MYKTTLFQYADSGISINIEAFFDGEKLVIEGYDIGKKVEEVWGDSDYEYITTIPENEVKKLYALMEVNYGDKYGLIQAIANKYNTNTCYSQFNDFLSKNDIKSEGFSWT
jgi:hypothetical protein